MPEYPLNSAQVGMELVPQPTSHSSSGSVQNDPPSQAADVERLSRTSSRPTVRRSDPDGSDLPPVDGGRAAWTYLVAVVTLEVSSPEVAEKDHSS